MLTTDNTYSINRGRAENSKSSGFTAPTDLAGFFISALKGRECEEYPNNSARLLSCFQLPTPYGLREQSSEKGKVDMTTLSEVYGVYTNLRQIFNSYNPENYDKDTEEANTALCGAMCSLETACAYIPMVEKEDRRIKFALIKSNLTAHTEDFNNIIHPEELTDREKEALTMVEQLMREEK